LFALRRLTLDGELVRTIEGNFFLPCAMAAAAGRVYFTEFEDQADENVGELRHVGSRLHVVDIEAGVLMQTVNLPLNEEEPQFDDVLVHGDEIFVAKCRSRAGGCIHVLGMAVSQAAPQSYSPPADSWSRTEEYTEEGQGGRGGRGAARRGGD